MPFANNQGIRIHYEVEGEGPPLVLHAGFSLWIGYWHDAGYVEALKDDYQLILMDSRGCGASDKPHDVDGYGLALRVADVVAVLDDLDVGWAHFYGYSMGAYIGWGIAKYAPQRFLSLIMGGGPQDEETWEDPGSDPTTMLGVLRQGSDAWLAYGQRVYGHWWQPKWNDIVLASDIEALAAMATRWEGTGGDDVLSKITTPCLLFVGEKDVGVPRLKQISRILPDATFVSFPDLDHVDAFHRTDLVLPHITKFLAGVSEV